MFITPKPNRKLTESLDENPDLFAFLLFCRTITNFKGAIIVFQQGLIIEAQTLQRSCFENSIWLRRLAHEGPAFANLSTRAEIEERIKLGKGGKRINARDGQLLDGASEDYAEFRRLSLSAAHPSSTALLRHFVRDGTTGELEISVEVVEDDGELNTNLFFTVAALMNTLNSFIECLSSPEGLSIRNTMAARIAGPITNSRLKLNRFAKLYLKARSAGMRGSGAGLL